MASVKVTDDVVIEQLLSVFRTVGYDGASMAQLAEATGLQKASLYHRFPNGKQAMAGAVLDYIDQSSQIDVVAVLLNTTLPPAQRLKTVLAAINDLYDGGQLSCVLRALSLGSAAEMFRSQIAGIFTGWINGFTRLALDLGRSEPEASQLAQNVVVGVQGALILAQTLQQPAVFGQTLARIDADFLARQ
ncbi:MAG: TetR/AcrR family transcriptional regulator [Bacteroidetes bacterium]|nr:TetR/AcrR family transcriptional regulator [Fibrella sp.]